MITLSKIRSRFDKESTLKIIGGVIGLQAVLEWVFNHPFEMSCIGTALIVWAWIDLVIRLGQSDEYKKGDGLTIELLSVFTLVGTFVFPLALTQTAPPFLRDHFHMFFH